MLGLGRQSSDDKNIRQKLVRSGADSKAAAPRMSFWGDQGRQKRFLLPCYLLPLPGSYVRGEDMSETSKSHLDTWMGQLA